MHDNDIGPKVEEIRICRRKSKNTKVMTGQRKLMEKKNISRAERITVEVLLKDCIGTVNPLFYLFLPSFI